MLKKPDLDKPIFRIFPNMISRVMNNLCVDCGKVIKETEFKSELAKREYSISGLCNNCQVKVFKSKRRY